MEVAARLVVEVLEGIVPQPDFPLRPEQIIRLRSGAAAEGARPGPEVPTVPTPFFQQLPLLAAEVGVGLR